MPAIAILLIEIVAGIDKSTKMADKLVAGAWLELFGYVVDTTKDDDFGSILHTCRGMMEVASASIDNA